MNEYKVKATLGNISDYDIAEKCNSTVGKMPLWLVMLKLSCVASFCKEATR